MPLPMDTPPRPDDSTGSAHAAPSWAADAAEAAPAPLPAATAAAQLPLFKTGDAAPAAPWARHARLRSRIKALLGARVVPARPDIAAAEPGGPPNSSWPDSFFDADAGPGP